MGLADQFAPANAAQAQSTNVTPIAGKSTASKATVSATESDAKSALKTGALYVVFAVGLLVLANRFLNDVRIG